MVRLPGRLRSVRTIDNRFNRWSWRGLWVKSLAALVDAGVVTRSTAIDSTYVKIPCAAFGAKGGRSAQAIGRSRGGWTTKIHALTNVVGRPFALTLTPGNVSDITAAPALLEHARRTRYLLGDKPVLSLSKGATTPTAYAVPSVRQALSPSFLDAATGSEPSATTNSDTGRATSSKTPFVA